MTISRRFANCVLASNFTDRCPAMMSLRTVFLCLAVTCTATACTHSTGVAPTSTSSSTTSSTTYGLTGQVVRAGTTVGIGSAAIALVDSSGNVLNTSTDETGAFAFGATLVTGTYYLQAAAPGYIPSTSSIGIPVTSFTVQLLPLGTSPPVTTLSLSVGGPATLRVGSKTQLTATVVYTDGTQKDVTSITKWASTAPTIASTAEGGLMTAYAVGVTTITATFQDVTGSLITTVTP